MSYGPNPWQQAHWDWRAAGNFMCGGAGSGLIVFTALSGVNGTALAGLMLGGLALLGLGLLCVGLEIGRPLRALRVFVNPRSSWMSREAITATLLFPTGLAAAFGVPACRWAAAALALLFLFAQSRMLRAARGIPAWREPLAAPWIFVTGLAEGGGLFVAVEALLWRGTPAWHWLFGSLVLVRVLLWFAYRRALLTQVAVRANLALDQAGRVLQIVGAALPLALLALVSEATLPVGAATTLVAIAGLAAASAGAWVKYALITRAAFNQGFALVRLPVRGVRP
jgi:phenylacetyl-CoA:acceptor oxidoreductase subunit 2